MERSCGCSWSLRCRGCRRLHKPEREERGVCFLQPDRYSWDRRCCGGAHFLKQEVPEKKNVSPVHSFFIYCIIMAANKQNKQANAKRLNKIKANLSMVSPEMFVSGDETPKLLSVSYLDSPMMLLMTGGCWEINTFSPLPLYKIPARGISTRERRKRDQTKHLKVIWRK